MWAVWGACVAARPALARSLYLRGGASQKLPSLGLTAPPHQSPAKQPGRTHACHPPPACTSRAPPEPAPAFTTMFKGLSKGSQGKGSPKGSPAKGSPKGSPSKHSR